MIEGNDGGANVSNDGGRSWTAQDQATAQFYRVALDNDFPYNIYGAQQDNSTVRIASPHGGFAASTRSTGGTSAAARPAGSRPHPKDSNIVFAGSYGGYLTRYDHRTGQTRAVNVWPDNPMGYGAEGMKYRFQWNFPILFCPHDANLLYTAGNVLFKTTNEGQSWTAISGDLTRNDKSKLGPSGGPITKDNTSVEYYCTIFTVSESPLKAGVIWTGSDDGLVHITARRRQELDQRHAQAAGDAGVDSDQLHRGVAARRAEGLFRGHDVQARRLPPLPLQHHRLRQDLEEDRQRNSRRRVHPRDSRGSASRRACSTPAPKPACTSRSTTARTGSRCS